MANEELAVFAAVNRKGGSGKTFLIQVLGSAILSAGQRVAFIDTDGQGSLQKWADRANDLGLWPNEATCETILSLEELRDQINRIYKEDLADFVLIDTVGIGLQEINAVIQMSDKVVIPCLLDPAFVEITIETCEWIEDVLSNMDQDRRPSYHVVITNVPNRLIAEQKKQLEALRELPCCTNTMVAARNVYLDMRKQGPLYNMAVQKKAEGGLSSVRGEHYLNGLKNGLGLLNELMGADEEDG